MKSNEKQKNNITIQMIITKFAWTIKPLHLKGFNNWDFQLTHTFLDK